MWWIYLKLYLCKVIWQKIVNLNYLIVIFFDSCLIICEKPNKYLVFVAEIECATYSLRIDVDWIPYIFGSTHFSFSMYPRSVFPGTVHFVGYMQSFFNKSSGSFYIFPSSRGKCQQSVAKSYFIVIVPHLFETQPKKI